MKLVHFAIPGALDAPTGGYGYDRRLIAELPALGWEVRHLALPGDWPSPEAGDRAAAVAALAALADGAVVLGDGLAFGAMAAALAAEAARLRLVALVHHPLGDESGLEAVESARLLAEEAAALASVRGIVCTSAGDGAAAGERARGGAGADHRGAAGNRAGAACAGRRGAADDPQHRVADSAEAARRAGGGAGPAAGTAVAGADRRVGLARSGLRGRAGRDVAARGLEDRIELVGAVADTRAELAGADIFALASEYEGYGMAFAEALSQGLPVVACDAGAIADLVPAAAGGLVPPGDPEAFAAALAGLLDDPVRRRAAAEAAWAAGRALPTWADTAGQVAAALERAAA